MKWFIIIFSGLLCIFLTVKEVDGAEKVPENPVDRIGNQVLAEKKMKTAPRCSDADFIRRVWLDAAGVVPQPHDVRSFLADTTLNKRNALIERVLRSDYFVDYQTLLWGDLLKIKSEFPSNLWPNGAQAYTRWVRAMFMKNTPYDIFVMSLLTGNGSNFHVPEVNFFRAFQNRSAQNTLDHIMLAFMGIRRENAGFTPQVLASMESCFSEMKFKQSLEWKEEIVFFLPDSSRTHEMTLTFPDGKRAVVLPGDDPRKPFASWLTSPQNKWFARNLTNRMWRQYIGCGLVNEVDNMHPDNPAISEAMLNMLAENLKKSKFDMRTLPRMIMRSELYQRAAGTNETDSTGFSHYLIRKMEPESLIDAICQITEKPEKYMSSVPEPFTNIPYGQRAGALMDASISTPFLETFGRPARNTAYASERTPSFTTSQAQYLLNSTQIQNKILGSHIIKKLTADLRKQPPELVNALYLRILSRYPTADEQQFAVHYLSSGELKFQEKVHDLAWALLNTTEFILKH